MKILFICHGNICRSPMAEFMFRRLAIDAGLDCACASKACSYEEEGNGIYPPARAQLRKRGVPFTEHAAHRTEKPDYADFDLIVCMDHSNLRLLNRIYGEDPEGKVRLLMGFAGKPGAEVSDPWYTGDFDRAYLDILEGCKGLVKYLKAPK